MGLFGSSGKTVQQQLRENKRSIDRAVRDLDRERIQLQNQEKKQIQEIKKMAKQEQMAAARIMAKDLVRTRRYVTKFYKMRTQLQAVALRIQTLKSTEAMCSAMSGVARVMQRMNQQLNLPQLQRIMMNFERQSEALSMKEDMVSDAIDDVFDEAEDEEQTETLVNQIFDEIGIDIGQGMVTAPSSQIAAPAQQQDRAPAAVSASAVDADLQSRLDNLRRT